MIWYLGSWIAGATIRLTQMYAPTNIIAGAAKSHLRWRFAQAEYAFLAVAFVVTVTVIVYLTLRTWE